jgi:hypothetical protein
MSQELSNKLDTKDFDEYEELIRKRLDEHQSILVQKSNIKDVCALLDMKSNIEDVNKALSEVSDEL